MSVRLGSRLLITRHGSMLGRLQRGDLLEASLSGDIPRKASFDLPIHRAIYNQTTARAILHAHPPHALAIAFMEEAIIPPDVEGEYHLGRVPVEKGDPLAEGIVLDIVEALQQSRIVIVRRHGSYAIGRSLEEAFQWTSTLEESCRVAYLLRLLKERQK